MTGLRGLHFSRNGARFASGRIHRAGRQRHGRVGACTGAGGLRRLEQRSDQREHDGHRRPPRRARPHRYRRRVASAEATARRPTEHPWRSVITHPQRATPVEAGGALVKGPTGRVWAIGARSAQLNEHALAVVLKPPDRPPADHNVSSGMITTTPRHRQGSGSEGLTCLGWARKAWVEPRRGSDRSGSPR